MLTYIVILVSNVFVPGESVVCTYIIIILHIDFCNDPHQHPSIHYHHTIFTSPPLRLVYPHFFSCYQVYRPLFSPVIPRWTNSPGVPPTLRSLPFITVISTYLNLHIHLLLPHSSTSSYHPPSPPPVSYHSYSSVRSISLSIAAL